MDDDAIAGFGLLFIGLGILLIGAAILMVIWFIISAIIAYVEYREYLKEAGEEFDEIVREEGADLPVDDTLRAYGIDISDMGQIDDIADLLAYGTVLGVDGD